MTPDANHSPVIILVGPTAIGKTDLSLKVAKKFNCEIVSVDSMQVYRFMDIGTAKVTPAEREAVPHHLIDIVNPDESYDAVRFARDGARAISQIIKKGRVPLLTGGTGLYLRSMLYGIFPGVPEFPEIRNEIQNRLFALGSSKLHEELVGHDTVSARKIHPNDSQRITRALEVFYATGKPLSTHLAEHNAREDKPNYTNTLQVGLTTDRDILYERINKRCHMMLESGLEEEVRGLLGMGYSGELNSMNSIGYRHMLNYIRGKWSESEMVELLSRDTRRYAKRQYTWFNKIPHLYWHNVENHDAIIDQIQNWLVNKDCSKEENNA